MGRLIAGKDALDPVDAVIFDKDGTLIDIHHYWGSMVRLRSEYLAERYLGGGPEETKGKAERAMMDTMGIDLKTGRIKPEGPVGIKHRNVVIKTAHDTLAKFAEGASEEDVSKAFVEVDKRSAERMGELVTPLPGAERLLKEMKANGMKAALATTDITPRAKLAMETVGYTDYFEIIAGADMVEKTKPAPDLFRLVAERMGVECGKCAAIGDAIVDLQTAENAGCMFIGVKTGLHSEELAKRCGNLVEDLTKIRCVK